MTKKTVRDIDVAGKRVLLRAELNVPFVPDTTTISDDSRIKATLPTIRYLQERGAGVVLCAHLGRPNGQVVEEMRLAPVANRLKELLGDAAIYVQESIGPQVEDAVSSLAPGQVLLLENLRFHAEEEKDDAQFARALASLVDVYVDDAFGASHRAHASIHAIARYLPAVAGLSMEKELHMLGAALDNPKRPLGAVIGGAKVSDKVAALQSMVRRVGRLFIGGGMATTFFSAQGHKMGKSPVEPDSFRTALNILKAAEDRSVKVFLPADFVVATEFAADATPQTVPFDRVPDDTFVMDIGPATVQAFTNGLLDCRTVLWNGPLGVFEWEQFSQGTRGVAHAIAGLNDATTVIGGGSTAEVVLALGLSDKMDHVSTGGGASLEFLEGKELPGVAVLLDKEES